MIIKDFNKSYKKLGMNFCKQRKKLLTNVRKLINNQK